jgi:membrane protease YdiL (CAAX protease family)
MPFVLALSATIVLAIGFGGCLCWVLAALKVAGGQPLIDWSKRRPVPWALLDLVGIFVLYVVSIFVVQGSLNAAGMLPDTDDLTKLSLGDSAVLVAANIAASLGLLVVALPLVVLRTGATLQDFGLVARKLADDIKLGIIAFLMLAPPVYVIQGLLVYFWQPSKHPLMEMFKASPDPGFYALLFVAAAVVAPIFEEIVFRVILQGFLEKALSFRHDIAELMHGFPTPTAAIPVAASVTAPTESDAAVKVLHAGDPLDNPNPFAPSAVIVGDESAAVATTEVCVQPEFQGISAWLPIGLSAIIFALLHFSHGPDWVALTLLACGMGYLYQRTHRLVPSLVVHALLNSLSMWGLWLQVFVLPEQMPG